MLNRTYGAHKNLYMYISNIYIYICIAIFTNIIWSYLLWSPRNRSLPWNSGYGHETSCNKNASRWIRKKTNAYQYEIVRTAVSYQSVRENGTNELWYTIPPESLATK